MVRARFMLSVVAAFAVLAASAAHAADYPQPPPPPQYIPPPPPQECCSSWYLRGNIGFSNQHLGSLSNANYALANSVSNADKGFDSAPFFGLGIGYTVNNWLRFDVTGEYRGKANFHGLDISSDSTGNHDDNYSASKSEWTFLANAYIDLGTWNCFTPFVGAGVGMSRNTISSFRDTSVSFGSDVYADTASKWSLAWALYAGVGFEVTKNLTVELTYRYLNLGDAVTGDIHAFDGSSNPSFTPFSFNNLTSNDIMLGLRWTCCDTAPPPPRYVYQPQPYMPPPPPLQSRG